MYSPFLFLRSHLILVHDKHLPQHRAYNSQGKMLSPAFPRGRVDEQLTQKRQKGLNLPNECIHGISILRQGESLFLGGFISCCGPDLALSFRTSQPSLRDQLHSFCRREMPSNVFYQMLLVAGPGWVSAKRFQYTSCLPF